VIGSQIWQHICKTWLLMAGNSNPGSRPITDRRLPLLHNDSLYTNNTIFVDAPHLRRVFSTFGDPDYLVSSDERICDFTHQWLQRLMSKSVLISAQAEGLRSGFFHQVRRKIEATKRRILAEAETLLTSLP
jgi:hypothetical protein